MSAEDGYWFRAKRYGWGWGLPSKWQGWVVMIAFLVLLAAGTALIPPETHPVWYFAYVAILSVVLIAVCWWKGEPPRWRWGGD